MHVFSVEGTWTGAEMEFSPNWFYFSIHLIFRGETRARVASLLKMPHQFGPAIFHCLEWDSWADVLSNETLFHLTSLKQPTFRFCRSVAYVIMANATRPEKCRLHYKYQERDAHVTHIHITSSAHYVVDNLQAFLVVLFLVSPPPPIWRLSLSSLECLSQLCPLASSDHVPYGKRMGSYVQLWIK